MRDLDRALTEISLIHEQLTRDTEFRGYGPLTIAATGLLAFAVAAAQAIWITDPATAGYRSLSLWIATAAVSLGAIVLEAINRSRREHGSLALPMLQTALEQFLPAIVAGGLLTIALQSVAPQTLWMMPGLWQIIFSLGVFASCRYLPRPMFVVGLWYLICGLLCLVFAAPSQLFSPWSMGIPFGVGQLLVAGFLRHAHLGSREVEDEPL
jgi:hypothetical protein